MKARIPAPITRLAACAAFGATLSLGAGSALAAGFSNGYFFGDSLSDTGNILAFTGGAVPAPPYFNGRFSNGPVWVEYLAAGIGAPNSSKASLMGGNNFSFGGARTGGGAIPSLLVQVGGFTSAIPAADPNALYVLVAGGNDMRDARSGDPANIGAVAAAATGNIKTAISLLASKGAKNILVGNLPDLGATPEAVALGLVAPSTAASDAFNALMPGVVSFGESLGLSMSFLDLAALGAAVRNDALTNGGAVYGITNVFTPCGTFQGSIGISCDVSQFSDALHPSARAHELLGAAAITAVPEPATYALFGLGVLMLAAAARRRGA